MLPDFQSVDGLPWYARQMAEQHPATFHIPSAEEVASIRPGMFAMVAAGDERFWVEEKKLYASLTTADRNPVAIYKFDMLGTFTVSPMSAIAPSNSRFTRLAITCLNSTASVAPSTQSSGV